MKLDCDVLIIGAGIAGSTLGLILARQGLRVSLVDHSSHPRFALGESLLRPTTLWMKVLAARYGVPELDVLADLKKISREIAPTSGIKQCFGFLHHVEGARRVNRYWWLNLPASFSEETLEGHLFRQDIDAYLCYSAASAGCALNLDVSVRDINIRHDSVCVQLSDDNSIRAEYLVDASGFGSIMARKFGLREQVPPFKTKSRAMFTHMLGVRSYDDLEALPQPARNWNDGTLHHIFDGGWMWVIPFGNHRASKNPLCSVGVSFDLGHYPHQPNTSPEREWIELLDRFPTIGQQFRGAVPVRKWAATGRLQYSSKSCVGDRYCLLSQAAGSVDALYSRGLLNTFQGINLTASLILDAFTCGDFSAKHFERLDRQQKNLLSLNDGIVRGTYCSFHDPDLFQVWLAIYSLCEQLSITHVLEPFHHYMSSGDTRTLAFDDNHPDECLAGHPQFTSVLNRCLECMELLENGLLSKSEAIDQMQHILHEPNGIEFDYDALISVVTRLNFTNSAQRLFEFERVFLEILDGIDEVILSNGSHRLRISALMSYCVRAVVKELVKSSQQRTPCSAATFGDPLRAILKDIPPDTCLPGISFDTPSLLVAIRDVRPEVAPTEQQKQDMLEALNRIIQLQACVLKTSAVHEIEAYETSLLDAKWQVVSKTRISATGGRLSLWRNVNEHSTIEEILIIYETECGQTYLVHIRGKPELFNQQIVIPNYASHACA